MPKASFVAIGLKSHGLEAGPAIKGTLMGDIHFQVIFKNGIQCQLSFDFKAENLKQVMEVLQAC